MNKPLRILSAAILAMSLSASAQALTTGDMAFTSFNADDDTWALVTFVDITANTDVYFSDNEWLGSAFADSNEHALKWNTGAAAIAAGTVITFTEIDAATDIINASIGTLALNNGFNLGLAKSNETFYAFLGSSGVAPTTFLTAITTENDSSPANITNAGLTIGVNAIALTPDADFGEYTAVRSGEAAFANYAALVNDAANWNDVGSGEFTGNILNNTAFSIAAPIPEADTYAFMALGMGLVSLLARRRNSQKHAD
jgi:hypothetical protein